MFGIEIDFLLYGPLTLLSLSLLHSKKENKYEHKVAVRAAVVQVESEDGEERGQRGHNHHARKVQAWHWEKIVRLSMAFRYVCFSDSF